MSPDTGLGDIGHNVIDMSKIVVSGAGESYDAQTNWRFESRIPDEPKRRIRVMDLKRKLCVLAGIVLAVVAAFAPVPLMSSVLVIGNKARH